MASPAPPPGVQAPQAQTSGAKDVVTAAATPRAWATVGQGVVNEVFWPAVDQPQVKDFGFLVRTGDGADAVWVEVKAEASYTVARDSDAAVPLPTIEHVGPFTGLPSRWCPILITTRSWSISRLPAPDGQPPQPLQLYALLAPRLGYSTSAARATGSDGRCHLGEDNYAWVTNGALYASTPQQEQASALCLIAEPGFSS